MRTIGILEWTTKEIYRGHWEFNYANDTHLVYMRLSAFNEGVIRKTVKIDCRTAIVIWK